MTGSSKRKQVWKGLALILCLGLVPACSAPSPTAAVAGTEAAVVATLASEAAPVPAAPAIRKAFEIKGVLSPDQPLRHGDYVWEEADAPAGPTEIVVDLDAQILYVYRNGFEIGRSAILYGADNKPTPTGTFPILQKKRHHISNLYGAPMPYMMRLTMDGIAIHASEVEWGSATHGCVGLPDEFAAKLFAQADIGDRVLITKGWRKDVYPA